MTVRKRDVLEGGQLDRARRRGGWARCQPPSPCMLAAGGQPGVAGPSRACKPRPGMDQTRDGTRAVPADSPVIYPSFLTGAE